MTPEEKIFIRLRKEAENHRVAPSSVVWDRLEGQLDVARSKRIVTWYKSITVAASLALFAVLGSKYMVHTESMSLDTLAHDSSYSLHEINEEYTGEGEEYSVDRIHSFRKIYNL